MLSYHPFNVEFLFENVTKQDSRMDSSIRYEEVALHTQLDTHLSITET